MNNEPVAWQHKVAESWVTTTKDNDDDEWIPLYTHPANKKVKENTDLYEKVCNCTKKLDLTDEEIAQAWAETKGDILHRLMPFAKAILRKAQEK